jgi:hypothetical protein
LHQLLYAHALFFDEFAKALILKGVGDVIPEYIKLSAEMWKVINIKGIDEVGFEVILNGLQVFNEKVGIN